ncbi:hypothetical protein ACH5RR_016376 [Cinchona calisaya]|uniref:DEAD/DEAH box helicase domain-containing protein n=1 Tax=Cinchona calisaya TaxID=153742 RepID=A0ABD2ZVV3_9GENT
MGKSDDSIRRRKNKKDRKKQENKDSSKVSNRIASIIAAKKRRLSGKRRKCQGMCFSLPTPEDPFNNRNGETDEVKNKKRRADSRIDRARIDKKRVSSRKKDNGNADVLEEKLAKLKKFENKPIESVQVLSSIGKKAMVKLRKTDAQVLRASGNNTDLAGPEVSQDCPSKFLILCLNSIQNALQHENAFSSEDRPFFVHKWGVEFWKFYSSGKDILETSGSNSTSEQIAWVTSCAADTIARKEKEGMSFSSPFLLFIVPSQEKAAKVRQICKPLKALGIHTVSLHPGASIDHQIRGLKSCEPEFLLSTADRLLELVSLKEVDISGISLLVIDGFETDTNNGLLDSIKLIRQSISGSPQTVVFCNGSTDLSTPVLQKLLQGSVCRISLDNLTYLR